jgi:hypothetical protein
MDFTRQSTRAAKARSTFLVSGDKIGFDGHEGIAHKLPDMAGVPGCGNPLAARRAAIYFGAGRCNSQVVTRDAHS